MKESLKRIVDAFHRYNTEHMAVQAFGLSEDITYDALVIAPSYTPYKLSMDETCKVRRYEHCLDQDWIFSRKSH